MIEDIHVVFEKFEGDYCKFKRIKNPKHPRPDIAAFLLLHELCPGSRDMVCSAEHDKIYLDVDLEELAKVATEEDILTLTRCGVRYYSSIESLAMFV